MCRLTEKEMIMEFLMLMAVGYLMLLAKNLGEKLMEETEGTGNEEKQ
jgi:hypothetical protein